MRKITFNKKLLVLTIVSIFITALGFGQTQIYNLDFETAGGYTTSIAECTNNAGDYFTRTDNSDIAATFINTQGTYFFAAQDLDAAVCPAATGANATLLIDDINISGYTNLEFRVYLAEDDDGANQDWDGGDYVHFNYDLNNSGTFSDLLWIEGSGNASSTNMAPQIDTDFNGVGDGTEITETFTQFTQNIAGTGNLIDIEIVFDLNAGDEDIAIDNIEIWGNPLLPNQIMITQYYEGDSGSNKWIEIKNISGSPIAANTYFIARFNNLNADSPSGVTPNSNEHAAIPALAVDEVILYKHLLATIPSDPSGVTIISSYLPDVNGDDLILISTSNDATCYDNRVDIIGDGTDWGTDISFVRGCGADIPNTTFTLSEWTQFELADVNTPVAADANVALGVHNNGDTTFDATFSWTNGTPDQSRLVIIDENYDTTIDGSFEACSLIVNAGNTLNILGTDNITVVNDITISGTIRVASEASLVQINDASTVTLNGAGIGEVQKTTTILTAWYDYTYWSSPVSNETIGSVFGLVPSNRIFEYDASNFNDSDNDTFDDEGDDWSIASGIMTPGRGYAAVAEYNGFTFPQNNTMIFDGQFNNGIITPAVTMSPGPNPLNWNFLGNPYPSPISAISFLNDPANSGILGGTLYFWTHNSPPDEANPGNAGQNFSVDDYATYNVGTGGTAAVTGGNIPTGTIATGQGFFVEGLSAGVATFNNSMRSNSGNTNFYRTIDKVWLNFKNDYGVFSQILVGFNEHATDGIDRLYDSKRLDAGSYVSFFSFINDEKYAIQSKSELIEDEIIPLGIMTTIEGETEFSISIDKMEGQLEESEIYLIDYYLNIEHDLNESDYTFNSINGEFRDRFALNLRSDLTDLDTSVEDELVVSENENGGMDFTTTHQSVISNVKVFDLLGRLIYNEDFKNETTIASLRSDSIKNTILIANVTLANGSVLTKKVIN